VPQERSAEQGPIGSLRRLGGTLLAMLHTRIELAGLELEEELRRFLKLFLASLFMVVFAGLALLVLTLALALSVEPAAQGWTLAALGLLYLFVAACIAWHIKRVLMSRTRMFAATLDELQRDRDALRGPVSSHDAQ
jgi:uncharacterized membrane protein YqjE